MTTTINASTSAGLISSADTSGILQFQTANIAALTINASQNVGVGTASPTEKLTVNGNIKLGTSGTSWLYGPATTGRSIYSNSDSTAYIIAYGSAYGGSNDAGLQFTAGTSNSMVFNSAGNLGLGVTPSAWYSTVKAFQFGAGGLLDGRTNDAAQATIGAGYYLDSGATYRYISTTGATRFVQASGSYYWFTAASGTAGNAITFSQAMTLDSSGRLLVGRTSGSTNIIAITSSAQGTEILSISDDGTQQGAARFFNCTNGGDNAAGCAMKIKANSGTSRSINAGGTINASGADYAEYMTKSGNFTIAKGDVVGINNQGKLTNVFADSVSFVVKSTDPSYVGGDTWGNEDSIGANPEKPVQIPATENTKAETDEAFAIRYAQYETDKSTFDAVLEAARQKVDRIAFSGQVPVNVIGATAGQYIVPINDNGAIKGQAVSNPTFEQYQSAVGKVIAIESDGRARIIVKVA